MVGGRGPILFVCIQNAGRSQMAEAFAKKWGARASSAGTMPSSKVESDRCRVDEGERN